MLLLLLLLLLLLASPRRLRNKAAAAAATASLRELLLLASVRCFLFCCCCMSWPSQSATARSLKEHGMPSSFMQHSSVMSWNGKNTPHLKHEGVPPCLCCCCCCCCSFRLFCLCVCFSLNSFTASAEHHPKIEVSIWLLPHHVHSHPNNIASCMPGAVRRCQEPSGAMSLPGAVRSCGLPQICQWICSSQWIRSLQASMDT